VSHLLFGQSVFLLILLLTLRYSANQIRNHCMPRMKPIVSLCLISLSPLPTRRMTTNR